MKEHTQAGPATEDLAIEAEEALRPRFRDRTERVVDRFRHEWQLYLLLLPAIIWLLVFLYKPMYEL